MKVLKEERCDPTCLRCHRDDVRDNNTAYINGQEVLFDMQKSVKICRPQLCAATREMASLFKEKMRTLEIIIKVKLVLSRKLAPN